VSSLTPEQRYAITHYSHSLKLKYLIIFDPRKYKKIYSYETSTERKTSTSDKIQLWANFLVDGIDHLRARIGI
jgi:hypothetical protein